MTKLGIVGLSPGNGHPFSFSAIINGYDDENMKKSEWDIIYNYLKVRDLADYGVLDGKVTHCWTQNEVLTNRLSKACKIENPVKKLEDMVPEVDGVIIARDDYQSHLPIAKLFLEKDIPVFIDKPLTLNMGELSYFTPYIKAGKLMSSSSFRFSNEINLAKKSMDHNQVNFFRGTIVNDWEKYGIHLIEGFSALTSFKPTAVEYQPGLFESYLVYLRNTNVVQINCTGKMKPIFLMEIFNENYYNSFEVKDNFSMFKRMLWHFVHSIKTKIPAIDDEITINIIKVLIAGKISKLERRQVKIDEL
ncbi:Gfo/Idh/MocA family oxidoreductase [Cytobacillus firmus]|uniref:Gfo/Idh/MocA family oxidoreductase n=1 Tax=Bacillus sp. 22-7 TaxID=2709707 RepID=UPI0013D73457|nr:Gfo/Idh/MocA family oxidoreductase [Bacillus sp. 22-7]